MLILKCTKSFSVEELDESRGNSTGKDYVVKKGTLWAMKTNLRFDDISDFDELNMVDEQGENIGDWLENVDMDIINECFSLMKENYNK